jgi:hypothetical protein
VLQVYLSNNEFNSPAAEDYQPLARASLPHTGLGAEVSNTSALSPPVLPEQALGPAETQALEQAPARTDDSGPKHVKLCDSCLICGIFSSPSRPPGWLLPGTPEQINATQVPGGAA